MRARFAPSPTGAMHAGNARTALLAWLSARRAGGQIVLRIEDLDQARTSPGAEAQILEDLAWLGLDWDEGPDVGGAHGPYRQSERTPLYETAIEHLLASDQAFLCACSRADVARAASAPHSEEGPRYPGTCVGLEPETVREKARRSGREPIVRFRGRGRRIEFVDGLLGLVDPLGHGGLDDFVIRRADGIAAYHLAVVIDDAAMAITEVLRGDDLLTSTPRQLALYEALELTAPSFIHVPLLLAEGGQRLAKRTRPGTIRDLRARGVSPEEVIGALAASAGFLPDAMALAAKALVATFNLAGLGRQPAVFSPPWVKSAIGS